MKSIQISAKVKVVLEIVNWINGNIRSDISSEDATRRSGYTHWHFQKLFTATTGYTLAEYIRIMRIISVAETLAKTKHKVTYISFDFGFPTQQSLARLFRRYFGCTPSEFRRAVRADPALYETMRARVLAGTTPLTEDEENEAEQADPTCSTAAED